MKILLQAVTRLLLLLKGDTSPALLGQILGLWGLYTLEEGTRSGLGQGHSTVPWLQETLLSESAITMADTCQVGLLGNAAEWDE